MTIRWGDAGHEEAIWWTLTKGDQIAVCRMLSHQDGHEMRFEIDGEFLMSQICRTAEEIAECQQGWRRSLEATGWREA